VPNLEEHHKINGNTWKLELICLHLLCNQDLEGIMSALMVLKRHLGKLVDLYPGSMDVIGRANMVGYY